MKRAVGMRMHLCREAKFAFAKMRHHGCHARWRNAKHIYLRIMFRDIGLRDGDTVGQRSLREPKHDAFGASATGGAQALKGFFDKTRWTAERHHFKSLRQAAASCIRIPTMPMPSCCR